MINDNISIKVKYFTDFSWAIYLHSSVQIFLFLKTKSTCLYSTFQEGMSLRLLNKDYWHLHMIASPELFLISTGASNRLALSSCALTKKHKTDRYSYSFHLILISFGKCYKQIF